MDKKAHSKPMAEIVKRITSYGEFDVLYFGDDAILHAPVEDWPVVDALLSWHSDGFPLKRAQAYVALRKPFCVNDLAAQDVLLDRRRVYKLLQVCWIVGLLVGGDGDAAAVVVFLGAGCLFPPSTQTQTRTYIINKNKTKNKT